MLHTTPEPEGSPSGKLRMESSDDEMSPESFLLWMEMMKLENVVLYYSEGPSSKKFRDLKRKLVIIFEKTQVLE